MCISWTTKCLRVEDISIQSAQENIWT